MLGGIIALFAVFTVSGFFTGLLGLGGGLVIVPVFMAAMSFPGVHLTYSVHQIIGISSACDFVNSAITLFLRRKEDFLSSKSLLCIIPATIVGTFGGAIISSFVSAKLLLLLFVLVSVISLILINKKENCQTCAINAHLPEIFSIFALIGAISASVGIGGAMLFAAALKTLTGKTPKELLPTITMLVFAHAFFAFLGKSITGNVVFPVIALAVPASFIGASLGIKLSRGLSAQRINQYMSLFLIVAVIKVLYETFFVL